MTCRDCGAPVARRNRYCVQHRHIVRACAHCGTTFNALRSQEDKEGRPRRYCGADCARRATALNRDRSRGTWTLDAPLPTGWREQAACVGHPPAWWDEEDRLDTRRALRVCAACPVASACLVDALRTPAHLDHGIRAVPQAQRMRLRAIMAL